MLIFVGILALGLAFAWKRGYLDWEKPEIKSTDIESPVPTEAYDSFRKS
jgi:NADH-quinone oxidoreductase subunit A